MIRKINCQLYLFLGVDNLNGFQYSIDWKCQPEKKRKVDIWQEVQRPIRFINVIVLELLLVCLQELHQTEPFLRMEEYIKHNVIVCYMWK